MKTLEVGPYRQRITFQTATDTPNGRGGTTRTWIDAFTVWGYIAVARPYRPGTEQLDDDRPVAQTRWTYSVRYSSAVAGLNAKQRFTSPAWPGKTFEIESVTNTEGRNIELTGHALEIDE